MGKSKLDTTIIDYISVAQPELEKLAEQKTNFVTKLRNKLDDLVKKGSLTHSEADRIYDDALDNPISVLDHLEVPSYSYKLGSSTPGPNVSNKKLDAFQRLMLS